MYSRDENAKGCGGKFPPRFRGNSDLPSFVARSAIGAEPLWGATSLKAGSDAFESREAHDNLITCGIVHVRPPKFCGGLMHVHNTTGYQNYLFLGRGGISGRMAKLADAIALGAIGVTLGGSSPLPPIKFFGLKNFTPRDTTFEYRLTVSSMFERGEAVL